jgi:hypothetical protein
MPKEKVSLIRRELLYQPNFITSSYEELTESFLEKYLRIKNPYTNLAKTRQSFITKINDDVNSGNLKAENKPFKSKSEVPHYFKQFVQFISLKVLHLKHEPKTIYSNIYNYCNLQAEQIKSNIENLNTDLKTLKNKEQKSTGVNKAGDNDIEIHQIKIDIALIKHLLEQNNSTLEEIGLFLLNQKKITTIVRTYCISPQFYESLPNSWYTFHENEYLLQKRDWKKLIFHFIQFFPYPIREDYFLSLNPTGMRTELLNVMSKEKLCNEILESTSKHHITNRKKAIISDCVNSYKDNHEIAAANLVPAIIEGLIYELCIELKIKDKGLINQKLGLGAKLKMLSEKNSMGIFDYEFLMFILTIYRNQMAHGVNLSSGEYQYIPILLMLMLHRFVNEIIHKINTPLNISLYYLNRIKSYKDSNDFRKMYDIMSYLMEEKVIPPIYNKENEVKAVHSILHSQDFLNFIKKVLDNPEISATVDRKKIVEVLAKNKVKGIDFKKYRKTNKPNE